MTREMQETGCNAHPQFHKHNICCQDSFGEIYPGGNCVA